MTLGHETVARPPQSEKQPEPGGPSTKGLRNFAKPSTAQLPQAAGTSEGFELGGFCCESDEVRVYGTSSRGFPPSLFNSLEREREREREEMQRKCWNAFFLSPQPIRRGFNTGHRGALDGR